MIFTHESMLIDHLILPFSQLNIFLKLRCMFWGSAFFYVTKRKGIESLLRFLLTKLNKEADFYVGNL